jgi:hypothetical protein
MIQERIFGKMAYQQVESNVQLGISRYWHPPYPLDGHIFMYGRIGCLDEDTEIFVENDSEISKVKLKDLPENFNVISYNKQYNRKQISKAIKINSGQKECYEIEFENGEKVIATKEHVFFKNKDKQEIKVENLKIGDDLFFAERIYTKCYGKNNVYCRPDVVKKIKIKNREHYKNPTTKMLEGFKKISKYAKAHSQGKDNNWSRPEVIEKIKKIRNTPENKKRMSESVSGNKNPMFGKVAYPPLQFINELNHNVRSSWEREVCIRLKKKNIDYDYEPTHFKLIVDGKMCSYTPDIKIENIYLEVKGPLFDWQLKKMQEFVKTNDLIIITGKCNFKRLKGFNLIDYDEFIKEGFNVNSILKNDILPYPKG